MKVNVHEAKSQVSRSGPVGVGGGDRERQGRRASRKLGVWKGQVRVASDFDETPQEVIDSFQDSNLFPGEDE